MSEERTGSNRRYDEEEIGNEFDNEDLEIAGEDEDGEIEE
jgi:hypothetical protein